MPAPPKKTRPIPKTIGACADTLYATREQRLSEQKDVAELDAYEKAIKEHLIATLPKSDSRGAIGKVAKATIVTKMIPIVEDWELFYKYLKKTGQFELMQKRLNEAAIHERWEAGKKVPGVGAFNAVSVSVTKV
jgi:hypothetical protein